MGYMINQTVFDATFININGKFTHKTNVRYNLFPYNTKDQADKILADFDGILGAFFQEIYSVETPNNISREDIIKKICDNVSFPENSLDRYKLENILRELYFANDHSLKCNNLNTFKYISCAKNVSKISEYIVSTICDKEAITTALVNHKRTTSNVMDTLVEKYLPKLSSKKPGIEYLSLFPQIKELFTKDLICLIENSNTDFSDYIQLISYYYFFYTSQVILRLNEFFSPGDDIIPLYFCMGWEKTSKGRACYNQGWHRLEDLLNEIFSHAVLLEMLNQTGLDKKYSYKDILDEYNSSDDERKNEIFSCIESIKTKYRNCYAPDDNFEDNAKYEPSSYAKDDVETLIKEFHSDIVLQFKKSSRQRANEAFQKGFSQFCKDNFLQNRKKNGLILVLNEEQLILFTKIIISKKDKMRLNELFDEFARRGIGMDKPTHDCVIEYYERLNIIEKKSDSGDAKYVKGIF